MSVVKRRFAASKKNNIKQMLQKLAKVCKSCKRFCKLLQTISIRIFCSRFYEKNKDE